MKIIFFICLAFSLTIRSEKFLNSDGKCPDSGRLEHLQFGNKGSLKSLSCSDSSEYVKIGDRLYEEYLYICRNDRTVVYSGGKYYFAEENVKCVKNENMVEIPTYIVEEKIIVTDLHSNPKYIQKESVLGAYCRNTDKNLKVIVKGNGVYVDKDSRTTISVSNADEICQSSCDVTMNGKIIQRIFSGEKKLVSPCPIEKTVAIKTKVSEGFYATISYHSLMLLCDNMTLIGFNKVGKPHKIVGSIVCIEKRAFCEPDEDLGSYLYHPEGVQRNVGEGEVTRYICNDNHDVRFRNECEPEETSPYNEKLNTLIRQHCKECVVAQRDGLDAVEKVSINDPYFEDKMRKLKAGKTKVRCKTKDEMIVKEKFQLEETDISCFDGKTTPSIILCEKKANSCPLSKLVFSNPDIKTKWLNIRLRNGKTITGQYENEKKPFVKLICRNGKLLSIANGKETDVDKNIPLKTLN